MNPQQAVWAAGDFARIGSLVALPPELLCEAIDIHPGERVLDVAAGNGAAALAAARRLADVVAVDFVEHLLASAAKAADALGLGIRTQVADAQSLPFEDDSFDVVLSTYGVMFVPDQQRVAGEVLRVCRPGGRIGLTNWTPDSLIGEIFTVTASYLPPAAPGSSTATDWGTEERLRELFGRSVREMDVVRRQHTFRFFSPEHMLGYYRTWYGPTKTAFEQLDDEGQEGLASDLIATYRKHNRTDDGTLVAPSSYLQIVAIAA